jgi:hypothetical protein
VPITPSWSRRTRVLLVLVIASAVVCIGPTKTVEIGLVPATAALRVPPPPPQESVDRAIDRCRDATGFVVGAARADITGPMVDSSTGWNEPGVTMEGLAMRLYARAFVLESPCSGQRFAYVDADLLHTYQSISIGVVKRIGRRLPGVYDARNTLIAGTHDHAAPSNISFRTLYNLANGVIGFDQLHYDIVVDGIVEAIVRAHESRRPAAIHVARGHLPGAVHNRSPAAYAANPDAGDYPSDVDDAMVLLRFAAEDGTPIGALDWFAVHGTSLSQHVHLLDGDNKGYAAYRMTARPSRSRAASSCGIATWNSRTSRSARPTARRPAPIAARQVRAPGS